MALRDTPSQTRLEASTVQGLAAPAAQHQIGHRCRSGEPSTWEPDSQFDKLCRDSYARVLYTVLAIVHDYQAAEDCTQDAFLRAYEKWHTWKGDAPAEAWLHQICINVARSHRRWCKLREIGELVRRLGGRLPRQTEDPDLGTRSALVSALHQIPPEQAAAIVLRYVHGYSNREIAVALRIPESTVASRLAAAKERLRRELQ